MDIIHPLHDNSFGIDEPESLKARLVEYYTYNGVSPVVEIKGGFAHVHVNEDLVARVNQHLDKALAMIKRGEYRKAIAEYERVIHDYPMHSEAYRQLAQAKFMLKDIDGAVNYLVALQSGDLKP